MEEMEERREQSGEKHRRKRTSNPKTLVSWRITAETERQLDELRAWMGGTMSNVMQTAVDRMYQQEARRRGMDDA